tara:strand:+ start:5601 stop:5837 length:237 start_codon:yes stop_codon:yes gene_type:complete
MSSIINQLAHVLAAFMVVIFVRTIPWPMPVIQTALMGMFLGLVREVTQMQATGDKKLGLNRLTDIAFWTVGGAVGGMI